MPFNLNWKEMLLIAAFLIGGVAIVSTFNSSKGTTTQVVTSDSTMIKSENIGIAATDNTLREEENPNKEDAANSQTITSTANQTTPITTSSVESPLSGMKSSKISTTSPASGTNTTINEKKQVENVASTKTATSTSSTPTSTKINSTNKAATPPIKSSVVSTKAESRSVAPLVTVTPSVVKSLQATPKNVETTSSATPTKVTASGNFYLVAASRNTFEEAQASFDNLKNQGYNPLLLSPIKSKGINNYRIAIFRSNDRKKVEDFTTQINGKGQGYWIDQR